MIFGALNSYRVNEMNKFYKRIIIVVLFLFLIISQLGFINAEGVNYSSVDSISNKNLITSVIVEKKELHVDEVQNIIITFANECLLDEQFLAYYTNTETNEESVQKSSLVENYSVRFSFKPSREGIYQINRIEAINTKNSNTYELSELEVDVQFGVGMSVATSPDFIMSEETTFELQSLKMNKALPSLMTASLNNNLVVVLDPGHGGGDPGAVRTYNGVTYKESELNLKIANACEKELKTYSNVNVYMTRRDEVSPFMDRSQRIDFAKKMSADVIVSIHLNASTNINATGAEVYIPNLNYRPELSAESKALANSILNVLISDGMVNRGTTFNTASYTFYPDGSLADSLGINYYSKLAGFPGILIEHCFLSNYADFTKYLNTDVKLEKLGISDATGIARYYNLSKLKINPDECTTYLGVIKELIVSLGGNIIPNNSVSWDSSDLNVASVDGEGRITPIGVGSCIISCTTTNGLTSNCVFNVRNRLEMNTGSYSFYPGQKSGLAVTLDGNKIDNNSLKWSSSNDNVVCVDGTGLITGINEGQAEIYTVDEKNNLNTKCIVTVLKTKQVSLNTSDFSLFYNTKSGLAAYADGIKVDNSLMQWSSSNNEIVKVDSSGMIYALKGGTAFISCTMPYGTAATCQVNVLSVLKLNTNSYSFFVGDKSGFAVTLDGLKIDNSTVNWSTSNSSIVKVDNGVIFGISSGKATIYARNKSNELVSECQVEVMLKNVVSLNTSYFEMYPSTKSGLAAYIDSKKINNLQMQWSSSNEQVVKIGADGVIYGLKCGTTDVFCTIAGGTVAKCTVKVISNLKINTNTFSCYPDQRSGFAITVNGLKVNNSTANWSSSNNDIVMIDPKGVFYALKPGEVIIKAKNTVTDAYDECVVKVLAKDVVTLNTNTFSMYQGTKSGLAAYVNQNKVDNSKMQWSSSNDQIVKVDANGIIYGLKSGTAVVSCTTKYGTTAICTITVLPSFRINTNYFELYPGVSSGFAALLDGNKLDNALIQWSSSNEEVAKVDSNGKIYGISSGETTITAKDNAINLSSICTVKVLPFKTVKINTNSFSFYRGDASGFAAYIDGVKVNNFQMQWKSNNENVVKVYADGRIEAISAGIATISCTTLYGTTDECVVTVIGTYINGKSIATAQQMTAYYISKVKAYPAQNYPSFYLNIDAPTILRFCEIFLEEGEKEGIRGDIAFCQAMLETGFLQLFGSVPIQNLNFAGLGATGTADAPIANFPTVTIGIRAQIQHLKAYATPSTVEIKESIVDPRFSLVKRGVAKYVEWLGQKENPEGRGWATGVNYGYNILRIYNELTKFY